MKRCIHKALHLEVCDQFDIYLFRLISNTIKNSLQINETKVVCIGAI